MAENNKTLSNINLSNDTGIPVLSFDATGARTLNPENFNISGNIFTAYYDNSHRLIFVLDKTIDARKPNFLLIINPDNQRKWDDILSNDYGADLETIRPKSNNKYQKLDIEYNGLDIYNKLINDNIAGMNLSAALSDLNTFRNTTAIKSAQIRAVAAQDESEIAMHTYQSARKTINELSEHKLVLRDKLKSQKKLIGKEPTKKSAAKILKTESQLDALNEKLKRAERRSKHAQKRIDKAKLDFETANNIINNYSSIEIQEAKPMAEQIQPLINKDPEIVDVKLAFKPIEFGATPRIETPATRPIEFDAPVTPRPTIQPISQPAPSLSIPQFTTDSVQMPQSTEFITQKPTPIVPTFNTDLPIVKPESPAVIGGFETPIIIGKSVAKPTTTYYAMLVLLISLSVLTLWLYQKKMGDGKVPNLAVAGETIAPSDQVIDENPNTVMPESVFLTEDRITPETVAAEPTPAPVSAEPQKPEYDVNGPSVNNDTQPESGLYKEPIEEEQPAIINAPTPEIVPITSPPVVIEPESNTINTGVPTALCDDGTTPNTNGCCGDEVFSEMAGDAGFACCSAGTGECFPPIK